MKTDPRRKRRGLRGGLGAVAVVLVTLPAWGQSGGDFEILRSTLDGGGGQAAGGAFTVRGTIAQADAGPSAATAGAYALRGGFWTAGRGVPQGDTVFSDGFEAP